MFIQSKRYVFITNSYIESYHNQLKPCYFGRTKHKHINRMIVLFHTNCIIDYQQDTVQER